MVSEGDGLVELSDAIGVVREQLVAAQLAGRQVVAGQVVVFAVGKVLIEFSGEVRKATSGGGGLKFWVLTAEANRYRTRPARRVQARDDQLAGGGSGSAHASTAPQGYELRDGSSVGA